MTTQQLQAWEEIIICIEQKMGINQPSDWTNNSDAQLRQLSQQLTDKLIQMVAHRPEFGDNHFKAGMTYQQYKGKSHEEIVKDIHNKKNGLLNKYCIDVRTLKPYFCEGKHTIQAHKRNMLSLFAFGESFDERVIKISKQVVNGEEKKLKQFYGTHWWLYHFVYDNPQKTAQLGCSILKITDKNNVIIQNADALNSTNYKGRFELEDTNQHLFFEFTAAETNEKHLRISVFAGNGKCYPLMMGVYMNINAKNAMPAGTIIMGQIIAEESEIQKMTPILLDFDTAVDLGISPVIVDYFREKAQNYLKAPSKILSMGELNQWAKEKSILQNSTKVLY